MRKILVVDDEEISRRYLKTLFEDRGFSVYTAKNGMEALRIAKKDPPDIVVSDILMPVMDGFKLCKQWKSDDRLKKIPLVFLTGNFVSKEDEELARSIGANLVIQKTRMPGELSSRIEDILTKPESQLTGMEDAIKASETDFLEKYSEAISKKLDEKTRELKEINTRLEASEREYRSFFENAAEGLLRTTKEGRILMANPAFCRMLGYESFEDLTAFVTDVSLQLYVNTEDRRRLLRILEQRKTVLGFETRYRRKDESPVWVRLNMRAAFHGEDLAYYEGIVEDVTDRKRAEDELYTERQKFLTLAENAPFGMLLIDRNGNFAYINEMFKELFGYELNEIPNGREWFRKLYPDADYRHTVIVSWINDEKKAGQGKKRPRAYTVTCKDNTHKIINFIPVQLPTGETILSCEDITEYMQIQHTVEQSRTILRSLIDASSESLLMIDRNGIILVANLAVAQRLGVTISELVGSCLYHYSPSKTWTSGKKKFDIVFNTGKSVHFLDERADRIYEIHAHPVYDDKGNIDNAVIFASDITKRNKAEKQIRLNELRLQSLYEINQYSSHNIRDILDYTLDKCISITESKIGYIYFYDEENKVFTLSTRSKATMNKCTAGTPQTMCDLDKTGLWGEAVRQRKPIVLNDFQAYHPLKKGYPKGHAELYKFLTIPVIFENRIVLVVGVANKETDYDQSDIRQLTLLMDSVWKIVNQRKAEKALRQSEEKYRNIFENAQEGIFQSTPEGRFISINPALARMAGYASPEEMIETVNNLGEEIYAYREDRERLIEKLKTKGNVNNFEVIHKGKDGNLFWVSMNVRAIKDTNGNILHFEGTLEDITEHKLAEERLQSVLSQLEEKNSELREAYEELKESQKKTIQSEKMASIGQLAAGVAHEINNPTGFVISNLSSLQKYTERLREFYDIQERALEELAGSDGKDRETILERIRANKRSLKIDYILEDLESLVRESLEGADRVKKIVQDLKSFSRVDDAAYTMADIHAVLETTLNIVWNELKYKAKLKREYGEIPPIRCNPGQLSQVFMNILVNAAQAIEQYGEITIKTWRDSNHVFVSISDTGPGISEDNMKKLFDPFFTTKEVGKGTGLGLSISYDIITKHNGEIIVSSEPGEGTTMTVKIPIEEVDNESGNDDIAGRR